MDVEVKQTARKGKGVFATRDFRKGKPIFHYKKGRVGTAKVISRLPKMKRWYVDELDNNKFELMRPPARYVNHSCDPNALQKGRGYFALRNIKKGEEITVDYRMKGIFKNRWKCHCGSRNCKGYVISNFFTLPTKIQKKYLPYTTNVIRNEYKKRTKL